MYYCGFLMICSAPEAEYMKTCSLFNGEHKNDAEAHMAIVRFSPGDSLEMKKNHPCGTKLFLVIRVGASVRVRCCGCGRDMEIDRIKLEKTIKKVIAKEHENNDSV